MNLCASVGNHPGHDGFLCATRALTAGGIICVVRGQTGLFDVISKLNPRGVLYNT